MTPITPSEDGNGLAMRAGLFLAGLARSHAVRVLVVPVFGAPAPPGPLVRRHAADFGVLELERDADPVRELVARVSTAARRARLRELETRPTLSVGATAASTAAVADAASGVDAVHVMRLYLAPFVDDLLDREARPPMTLDLDDLESDARLGFGPAEAEEAARYARLESYYLPRFDRVTVAAAEDIEVLRSRRLPIRATHVPNAVPMPDLKRVRAEDAEATDLLFVGNLSYAPNVAAARWLVEEVLPLLGDGVAVSLVGSRPSREVLALGERPPVRVVADVPSVSPWYATTRVAVAPLQSGGGTRIKVIEALAHGRPVVSTGLGARGLQLADAVQIADSPAAFAAACRRLLDAPTLADRLGAEGRRQVAAAFTVDHVARRIDELLRELPG